MNGDSDISTLFTLPLDVIWKRQMGERYCTWGRLVGLSFFMYFVVMVMTLFLINHPTLLSPRTPKAVQDIAALLGFFGLPVAMWIFGAKNILEMRQRKKAGIQLHSFCMGRPRFLPNKEMVHRLIIPSGSILAGVLSLYLFTPVGAYIILMGVCQFLQYSDIRVQRKIHQIDEADRKMEREWRMAERNGGHGHPEGVVQIAEARHRHTAKEETDFNELSAC